MPNLETQFSLPRGSLPAARVRQLFELILDRFRWVVPTRYGSVATDERLDPGRDVIGIFTERVQSGSLTVIGKGGSLYFGPDMPRADVAVGVLSWFTPLRAAASARWRKEHRRQMVEVAKLLGAPVSSAMREEDHYRAAHRDVRGEIGMEVLLRLRGYEEGLLRPFWRNVYGPTFTELFGAERLSKLPPEIAEDCGDGYWLIEVGQDPTDAEAAAGRRRAADIVDVLGREYFYDFENERPPRLRPSSGRR